MTILVFTYVQVLKFYRVLESLRLCSSRAECIIKAKHHLKKKIWVSPPLNLFRYFSFHWGWWPNSLKALMGPLTVWSSLSIPVSLPLSIFSPYPQLDDFEQRSDMIWLWLKYNKYKQSIVEAGRWVSRWLQYPGKSGRQDGVKRAVVDNDEKWSDGGYYF